MHLAQLCRGEFAVAQQELAGAQHVADVARARGVEQTGGHLIRAHGREGGRVGIDEYLDIKYIQMGGL